MSISLRRHTTRKTAPTDSEVAGRFVSLLACHMAAAKVGQDALAACSGLAAFRIAKMVRGEVPITADEAAALSLALKCPADELVSRGAGPLTSGGAIIAATDTGGRPLPGVRLTRQQWDRALSELHVDAAMVKAEAAISSEGGDGPAEVDSGTETAAKHRPGAALSGQDGADSPSPSHSPRTSESPEISVGFEGNGKWGGRKFSVGQMFPDAGCCGWCGAEHPDHLHCRE